VGVLVDRVEFDPRLRVLEAGGGENDRVHRAVWWMLREPGAPEVLEVEVQRLLRQPDAESSIAEEIGERARQNIVNKRILY